MLIGSISKTKEPDSISGIVFVIHMLRDKIWREKKEVLSITMIMSYNYDQFQFEYQLPESRKGAVQLN